MSSTETTVLVAIAMAIGLVGTLLPFLPGLALILGAAIVYGALEGFGAIGVVAMFVIIALFLVGSVVSLLLARRSAARSGVPHLSLVAAVAGGIVGMFVIPVFGFVPGAIVGMLFAERARLRDWTTAWRGTLAAVKGYALGMLVEAACGVGMIASWAAWALLD